MKLLIVAATPGEADVARRALLSIYGPPEGHTYQAADSTVTVMESGVGAFRMAYAMGQFLAREKVDAAISLGIAGAFPGKHSIGDVVEVVSDEFYDLGAQNDTGRFLSLREMGLNEDIDSTNELINKGNLLDNQFIKTSGITVNLVHGFSASITEAIDRHDPGIETMENAAFFYACLKSHVTFASLRAISNIVEPRNRENWQIDLALTNLGKVLPGVLSRVLG